MDQELERFKSGIDLRAYAASQGYELDRKESWTGSAVMRDPHGDKVIIKRNDNNITSTSRFGTITTTERLLTSCRTDNA